MFHQTFIPASNSTTDRGERPDSKGQWIESRQSVTFNPTNGKQIWFTIRWSTHHHYCCQPFLVHLLWTICANSLRDLTDLNVAGPMSSWAHVRGFLCSVQSAPPIPLSHSLHRLGHYWIVRDGFGGHVIHGLHQTFIPASNSTMDRGERPDSKGQWIESRQSVTSNRMNGKQTWSTTLIKPPPLLV